VIGVFGGTFDPVHFGHLRPALEIYQALELDELRLIPCRVPPHRSAPRASQGQRLAMLQAAVRAQPGFRIDDREMRRIGPSYTVDTLRSLREEVGSAVTVCLIMGTDAFGDLPAWHRWTEIVELCHLVVMQRPGHAPPSAGVMADMARTRRASGREELRDRSAGLVFFQRVTGMEVSGTQIRELIARGLSPRYLIPEAVMAIIETQRVYG
jgi:nicotinate-nucleotide adenylyltransferase